MKRGRILHASGDSPSRTNFKDYEAALRTVEPMFDNEPPADTTDGDFFEIMCVLINEYENKHYPIEAPAPIEAIKFRMEQQWLMTKDLEPAIGKPNRVYEVLSRKRNLTLPMIRKLHTMFAIPLNGLAVGLDEIAKITAERINNYMKEAINTDTKRALEMSHHAARGVRTLWFELASKINIDTTKKQVYEL